MDYYNIDKIFSEEGKLRVKFNHKVDFFGFYYSPTHKSILPNKPVEMPLFLVDFLLRNDHCTIVNDIINEKTRNDLRAKASLVDLYNINPYFFNFSKQLCLSLNQPSNFLYEILTERLADYSLLIYKELFSEDDLTLLEESERKIILEARINYNNFIKFKNEDTNL